MDGANRNDFKMMKETLESIPVKRPKPTRKKPQGLCLDKGYDYDEVRDLAKEFGYTAHIRSRGEEAQAAQTPGGLQGPSMGGGTHAQLDEPLPPHPDAMGKEGRELSGIASSGLCRHHVPLCGVIRIGSKLIRMGDIGFEPMTSRV